MICDLWQKKWTMKMILCWWNLFLTFHIHLPCMDWYRFSTGGLRSLKFAGQSPFYSPTNLYTTSLAAILRKHSQCRSRPLSPLHFLIESGQRKNYFHVRSLTDSISLSLSLSLVLSLTCTHSKFRAHKRARSHAQCHTCTRIYMHVQYIRLHLCIHVCMYIWLSDIICFRYAYDMG